MKIALTGAGMVGVTTAYELAADGHGATVFERCSAVAEETSFANVGIFAPGYETPWSAPSMPTKVLGDIFSRHAAVRLSLPLTGHDESPRRVDSVLQDWFSGDARLAGGARPMVPDGSPMIGTSSAPGFCLNVGHGSSGWALSCGSARLG